MRSKFFTLLSTALLLVGAEVQAQCPELEKFNQGQGGANSCGGVNGTPIPANFIGTPYATVPPGTKTAELNAAWPGAGGFPNPVPAVGNVYFNAMPTDHESGPPTVPALGGGKYKAQYCFYHPTGANLPSLKSINIVYVDPQPDTILRVCSYDPGGNEIPPPVITRQPTDQVGCLGYKSIFSVAAIKGLVTDTAIKYQWMKDGIDMPGKTDSFLVITVTAADTGTDRYQCRIISHPSLAIQLTVEVSLTLDKQAVWTGAISTNWNTAGNWSPAVIPDSTKHVYVPYVANMPVIPSTDTGRCKCLTLDSGNVTLLNGRLEIAGRIQLWRLPRYINGLDGNTVLNGTELLQRVPDTTFLQNRVDSITFANLLGVVNIDTLDITGALIPIQGIFTTGGLVTLKSLPSGTARVSQGSNAGGYVLGEVTAERYIPVVPGGFRAWRFLSVLTTGTQTIKQAWQENGSGIFDNPWPGYGTFITCNSNFNTSAGFDQIMPNMSIEAFNEGTQSFTSTPVTNTNVKTLSSERAYFLFVRGDRTVLPAPVYNNGGSTTLRSKGLLRQGDQAGISVPNGQFAALGNPFASHIDFSAIAPADRSNVGNKFWLWDPRLSGSFGVGAWVLFDNITGFLPSAFGGSYAALTPNTLIPLGMGFLVQGSGVGASLSLRESIKFGSNSNNGFKSTVTNDKIQVQLSYVKDANTVIPADGGYAVFGDYSKAIDADDAAKMVNTGENLAIRSEGKDLSLDARPAIKENDTVNLKIWKLIFNYDYRLTITPMIQTLGIKATLVDKYLQTSMPIDLSKATNIDFKISKDTASYAINRFYIAMAVDPTTKIKDLPTADVTVYPNPTDAQNINLNIKTAGSGEYSFRIVDALGREVHNETYSHAGQSLAKTLTVHGRLVPGNYFIAISKDGQELASQKLIINK